MVGPVDKELSINILLCVPYSYTEKNNGNIIQTTFIFYNKGSVLQTNLNGVEKFTITNCWISGPPVFGVICVCVNAKNNLSFLRRLRPLQEQPKMFLKRKRTLRQTEMHSSSKAKSVFPVISGSSNSSANLLNLCTG